MPAGRTTAAYTPSAPPPLTEEEVAALAAEQAAAYGSDYAPAEPPSAAPVAAPVAAPQTTMYQPSSPPVVETAPTMSQIVPVGSGEVPDIQGREKPIRNG